MTHGPVGENVGGGVEFAPVIIIGAPRSGTNLLRDLLTSHPLATTWPCDEINYIWRHGNRAFPSDELPRHLATDRVRSFVRGRFERIARSGPTTHVVEKTCANCLRVPFVDAILSEARYVRIVRDGRDAVLSIMERWKGSVGLGYLLRKARFVPPTDVPYYAWRFLRSRIARYRRGEGAVASWGPRFSGIDEMVRMEALSRVCAEQWRQCVLQAEDALARHPADRVISVRYETLVASPEGEVSRIADFLGLSPPADGWRPGIASVHAGSVGRWKTQEARIREVLPALRPVLSRFGYDPG